MGEQTKEQRLIQEQIKEMQEEHENSYKRKIRDHLYGIAKMQMMIKDANVQLEKLKQELKDLKIEEVNFQELL